MAVETREENEFIKRVIDVEDKDMRYSYGNWILGGKRTGVGNDMIWVQTGQRIAFANFEFENTIQRYLFAFEKCK